MTQQGHPLSQPQLRGVTATGRCCPTLSPPQVDQIAKDYYKRLEPRDAAVLVKQLNDTTGEEA